MKLINTNIAPLILALAACSGSEDSKIEQDAEVLEQAKLAEASGETTASAKVSQSSGQRVREPKCADHTNLRKPLYGDLHVHTAFSFDAVAGRINTLPEDAYRFAKGEAIPYLPQDEEGNPTGSIQIDRPLDFLAVTDHAEFLGERSLCINPDSSKYDSLFCQEYRAVEFRGTLMLATMLGEQQPKRVEALCGEDGKICFDAVAGPWDRIVAAAEAANDTSDACSFTSFIGYEYTGSPQQSNYHRNVIFRNSNVSTPVSYAEARYDYMLWEQLDQACNDTNNCDYLTIPHNSNLSNGKLLTPYADLAPDLTSKRAYAESRLQREPIVEIFQHKGSSECINGLSSVLGAVDELCDLEQVRDLGKLYSNRFFHLEGTELVFEDPKSGAVAECPEGTVGELGMFGAGCVSKNDFLRSALLTGLAEQQETGLNPVKMGIIASTDGHTGTPGDVRENEWRGSVTGETNAAERLAPGTLPSGIRGNPGGLAGVWATENSRDAIFDAMERREVFGTSGPRIAPRFFGGWELDADSCSRPDMIERAYEKGVPMGGDLPAGPNTDARPSFLLAAQRDAGGIGTPLQQLQIIKGWIDKDGTQHNSVTTVAGVVAEDEAARFGDGHDSLCVVYEDANFDPESPAYYYLRAVENPSPRWSFYDCQKLPSSERPAVCYDANQHVTQEMAWSSPIWYTPPQDVSQSGSEN